MASTGSNRDADQAGKNPEINPIAPDTPIPNIILPVVSISFISSAADTARVSR